MKTFAFLTKDSFRIDVKASTPRAAYRKLLSIPHLAEKITPSYIQYDKDGLAALDAWRGLEAEEGR